jgi:two-component system NtrC family sensor kinase
MAARKSSAHGRVRAPAARTLRPSDAVGAADKTRSATRPRIPDIVPAAWLDRLLAAVLDLPLPGGELAVVEAMVDAVAGILPRYAVGACFVPEPGAGRREQHVVRRLPEAAVEAPAGVDPTRVFPGFAHEHVAPIPGSTTGSTLHVASDDDDLDRHASAAVQVIERAALALGRALSHARAMALLSGAQRDVRALEARMVQADKLATFGQIAAGVVHELNNPLTSIVAYSDYLIRKALGRAHDGGGGAGVEGDDVERLKRISESANRMLRFTRDLVSYARPSTGVAGPVVLHGVIDQAVAFCEHLLLAADVQVERRYGADVLTVRGVGEQLVQVFVNLLTNACHAAPPRGGRVVLSTALEGAARRVVIVVEDNGTGIAPEHLPHIFVPFFTTKGAEHGTGLGLSIVKSIVESHDGAIRAESDPGRGTRFVIELPAWQRA